MNENDWVDIGKLGFPEHSGRYLCNEKTTYGRNRIEIYCFTLDMAELDDYSFDHYPGFYSWDSDYGVIDVTDWVTHWMEIPSPPTK